MRRRVLIIEDNRDLAELISLHLADAECEVEVATDGSAGFAKAQASEHDLIILDLMLPGLMGLEICGRLRAQEKYVPILMLTARSSEVDRIVGLEIGADDYMTKPFSMRELVARVRAIFRRIDELGRKRGEAANIIKSGDLALDISKRVASIAGEPVELTAKEFDLLAHFAKNPGRVYTRSQLLDLIWGYGQSTYGHTVNSHINRLRSKIEREPTKPRFILTVWGIGYKFNDRLAG